MVLNITNNWRRKFGMNLTNFNILNRRNVLSTDRPESVWDWPRNLWNSSIPLKRDESDTLNPNADDTSNFLQTRGPGQYGLTS